MSLNTLTDENKELVSKLYALRAGLSFISIEADKIRESEAKLTELENSYANTEYYINGCKAKIDRIKKALTLQRAAVAADKAKMTKNIVLAVIGAVISGVLTVFLAISMISFALSGNMEFMGAFVIPWISSEVVMVAFIIHRIVKIFTVPGAKYNKSQLAKIEAELVAAEAELASLEKQLVVTDNERATCRKETKKITKASTDIAMTTYNTMYADYNDVLFKDDWKYVDYVIFAFLSNRANNITEALRCLDEERRYQGIVSAIDKAKTEVSQTIEAAFMSLGEVLRCQFESLENTIDRNARMVAKSIGEVGTSINENTAALGALNRNISMQNALLNKSNQTAEALAEDINYITNRVRMS